jgi:hypothetical protein
LLKESPQAHFTAVSKVILPSLMKRILTSQRMMDAFFDIALAVEDVAHNMRALEVLPLPSPPSFLKWTTPVRDLCLRVLRTNKSPQQRRYAILVWEDLLRRGIQPVHELAELLSFMKSEVDPRVRGPLLAIIGRSTAGMSYGLDQEFVHVRNLPMYLELPRLDPKNAQDRLNVFMQLVAGSTKRAQIHCKGGFLMHGQQMVNYGLDFSDGGL